MGKIKCSLCRTKFFRKFEHLLEHQQKIHVIRNDQSSKDITPVSYQKCGECGLLFKTLKGIARHAKIFHEKAFQCKECQVVFANEPILDKHLAVVHFRSSSKSSNSSCNKDSYSPPLSILNLPKDEPTGIQKVLAISEPSTNNTHMTPLCMQCCFDVFMKEKFPANNFDGKIMIRVVSSKKKVVKVTDFVRELLKLGSNEMEFTAKTIFLIERIGDSEVIAFAMWVHEFGDEALTVPAANRRQAFVMHFGTPSCLQGLDDKFHLEVFGQFLLAYLASCRAVGFERVFFSPRSLLGNSDEQPVEDSVFFGSDVVCFTLEWMASVFEDAKKLRQITHFESMAEYYARSSSSPLNSAIPCYIDDNADWSSTIEKVAIALLRLNRQLLATADCRPLSDVIFAELMWPRHCFVAHLEPSQQNLFNSKNIASQNSTQDDYLESPTKFLERCHKIGWDFSNFNKAAFSTARLLADLGLNSVVLEQH